MSGYTIFTDGDSTEPDKYAEDLKTSFKYSAKKINDLINHFGTHKAIMQGVYSDCEKLRSVIEKLYDEYIFYLSYWKSECGFHGWDWSEDNGEMRNMAIITDGITDRFLEIYALILSGLGLKFEVNDNGEWCLQQR